MILFKKITFYVALFSVIAMAVQVYRLSSKPPPPPPPVNPPVKPEHTGIGASGLVEAIHENLEVGVPVPGLLTAMPVGPGDAIQQGDLLMQIDDRDLRAQLSVQQANLKVAQAQAARVREQQDLLERVQDPYAVTEGEVLARRQEVRVAEAQVASAQAAITATEMLVERMRITAPIDGTVLQVNTAVGEFVSPQSQIPPMVIGNIQDLQLRADIDEQIAPRVVPGRNAIGYVKGAPDQPIALEFVRIEPYVIPKRSLTGFSSERVDTRVLQVIFRFPNNPERPIYVGQQMDIYIKE